MSKTIRVRTSYTGCPHITAGRIYEATIMADCSEKFGKLLQLTDDAGNVIATKQKWSSHIGREDWEILPEGPSVADELVEALQKCHDRMRWRGEGPNEGYERIAANFQRDTGMLAPGKDARESPSYEDRSKAFDQWFLLGSDFVVTALAKYKESKQ